ncbi:MAG TPA: FAD-binding oxidoreductase [Candidatus Tectomicrobia bacterium]|nr:FAD-binding oxidoreductase [Candidatus Tectomicrobia bacterium]
MRRAAEVVVIGGGANGASTAFHLTQLGVRDVVLVERRQLAAGATGKSGALVRMHYTNEPEARLAFESLKVFRAFDEIVGGDCGFEPVGFVQLVGHAHAAALRRNVERQRAIGIDTRVVGADDVRRLLPGVVLDDVGAAAWEPGSGFADPSATTHAFAAAAERGGAEIVTDCEALAITTAGDRVTGVDTTRGRIEARRVVVVAGAWSSALLAPLGLEHGLEPHRIQVTIFRWPAGFTHRHPAVIDAVHRSWFRPEGRVSTLIGVELGAGHADPEKYAEGVDDAHVARCRTALGARWPVFAAAGMRGGWAGMIMMSPDGRPIIDRLGPEGLWGMLGDSGTSFKTSPAIGRCLAEWIVEGAPRTVDLRPFRASRFAEGKPWIDEDNYGRERLTVSR